MAPEVLLNEKYSQSADVYSFAMVLYEVFSCRRPYSLPPHDQMNIALLNASIVQGARPNTGILTSPKLVSLIEDCWNQDPGLRPDFKEIISRLERLKTEEPPPIDLSQFQAESSRITHSDEEEDRTIWQNILED